jgi:hypothetical protein
VTSCGTVVPVLATSSCSNPVCFPMATVALLIFNGQGLTGAQCDPYCGTGGPWSSCKPVDDGGVSAIECDRACACSISNPDAAFVVAGCGTVVPTSIYHACQLDCFPLEAGALAKIDAGGGPLVFTQCDPLCGAGGPWSSCRPVDYGGLSLIECGPGCGGVGGR